MHEGGASSEEQVPGLPTNNALSRKLAIDIKVAETPEMIRSRAVAGWKKRSGSFQHAFETLSADTSVKSSSLSGDCGCPQWPLTEIVPVNSPVAAKKTGLPRASDATVSTVSVIVRRPDACLKRPVPPVIWNVKVQ